MRKILFILFVLFITFLNYSHENIFFDIDELHNYKTIMLIINPQTGIIEAASNGAIDYYKYPSLIGMNISEINQLSDEEVKIEMKNAKIENRNFFKFRHKIYNGKVKDVEVNSYPMKFKEKTILLSTIRDVTEENIQALVLNIVTVLFILLLSSVVVVFSFLINKLRRINGEKALLINSIPEILYSYSTKFGGVFHSDQIEEILGYSKKELKDSPMLWHDSIHKDDVKSVDKAISEAFSGIKFNLQYRILTKSGKYVWLHDKCIMIEHKNKETIIVGLAVDITRIKEKEKSLKDSELFLNTLIETIPTPIFYKDRQGVYTGLNKSYEDFFGKSKDDIIGKTVFEIHSPELAKEYHKKDLEILNSPGIQIYEDLTEDSKGNRRNVIFNKASILDKNNNIIGLVGAVTDITDIKKIQEDLIVSKEIAEKANKAKSEFLSNMSHEIRTPMNGILGFLDLLLQIETDSEKLEYLNIISDASEHLLEIINDILSLSKIEAGKLNVKEDKVNLFARINPIATFFEQQAKSKGLDFKFDFDKTLDKFIITDIHLILNVVNNLLSNSIKFTNQGFVSLSVKENEKIIIMEIKDTGIGINKSKQKHLFEPFEQGEHFLTKQYGGTGLGLSLVKKIIDLLDANISVKTEIGKGTEFTIAIPYKENKNTDSITVTEGKTSLKKNLRIISAEDVDVNRILLKKIFENEGVVLTQVNSGKKLLEELSANKYDIILLDIQMPEMNGLDTLNFIRNNPNYTTTPIIAVSAFAFDENIEKLKEAGADDFLSKPVRKKELLEKIKKWTT